MNAEYLKSLNEKQKEAVLCTEGPLLILAGAGAGKTKTVTHRILHLIHKGVPPEQILAITFTNKAAKEMRERTYHAIQSSKDLNLPVAESGRPFVSTFHSLGVHILKEHAQMFGLTRNFSIYDRSDSKSAMKEAIVMGGYDPKQYEPAKFLGIVSREKGNFVSQEEYEAKNGDEYFGSIVSTVWRNYEGILRKDKAFDFDDLLFKSAELLQKNLEVRKKYQDRWKYVHIDEYQDTNKVQYIMAKYLVGGGETPGQTNAQNIAVVGDIDQNIYSWRGADIKNILNFERDYPGAKVVLLEQNYRSTQNILSVANDTIAKNIHRREKNLFTENGEGQKITIFSGYDEADEASFIANTARDLIREGASASEIAVLYRANFQSRVLEEAFLVREIPYQLIGTKFYERKEVKDVLSYLKLSLNHELNADLKRVINVPVRGIGKVTLLKILEGKETDLPDGVRIKLNDFRGTLNAIALEISNENKKTSDVLKFVLKATGIEDMYKHGKEEDEERLQNVRELVTIGTKYDNISAAEGIEKLIEEASLSSDQDEIKDAEKSVRLMTVHASKGLEFDTVFICGLEQDLFPHARMNQDKMTPEEAEEERRLFYVALTRARKKLYLTNANTRTIFGNKQVNIPSEFTTEIDTKYLEEQEPVSGIKSIFIDF